jgi:hypothetical protein
MCRIGSILLAATGTARRRLRGALSLVALLALAGCDSTSSTQARNGAPNTASVESAVAPAPLSDEELAALPEATTHATILGAPLDTATSAPSGLLVHPIRTVPVYAAVAGEAIASLPGLQVGTKTWVPVVDERTGWVRVLLPSRPNSATGWLYVDGLEFARSPFIVIVDRAGFAMRLLREGTEIGRWAVGIGKSTSPTPAGRTFVLAAISDPAQSFSPVILPLGTHSPTHLSYGGGPGTVALHGWPTPDAFGSASSDGCIRIPTDALRVLAGDVPIGTPVLIT